MNSGVVESMSVNQGAGRAIAGSLGAQRVLVVSHPCVVPINQSVFNVIGDRGWSVDLVVPNRWKHEYSDGSVAPAPLSTLRAKFRPVPIVRPGQPQRHFYRPGTISRILDTTKPAVAFLEEETFSVPAFQWGLACWRRGIPFGVQADENLDRRLPAPARFFRSWTLRHASFVAARSPTAKELVKRWGARGRVEVIPHAVPRWVARRCAVGQAAFTIGFAGRFVPEKGLHDLLAAAQRVRGRKRLLFAGNGLLRDELRSAASPDLEVELLSHVTHEEMADAYAQMDILVLPSRTTPTWAEQFGRVLVEALWCGVPVIGSDSGEIPWVIRTTGGGLIFPEGDVGALADAIETLRGSRALRDRLAREGRDAVERVFSVEAAGERLDAILREVSGH